MKKEHLNLVSVNHISVLVLFALTLFAFLMLSSPFSFADSVTTVTTISVPVSCTMDGSVDTVHSATLINGTYSGTNYSGGIGQTSLKIFCNDSAGYAIYAIGFTNDQDGNNYLHWSGAVSESDTTNAINTGVYNAGVTTDSTWSMKLSSVAGTYVTMIDDGDSTHNNSTDDFTNWHEVPDAYKRVAYRLAGTDIKQNGSGTGSTITTTYDAYISSNQPAGSYNGQVKYVLVHPGTAPKPVWPLNPDVVSENTITYAPNAGDIIGSMSSLSQTTNALTNVSPQAGAISATANATVDLVAPNYKRAGYGFVGWSTEFDVTTATNPIIYGPNETVSTNPSDDRGLDVSDGAILYPVWIASTGTLQSFSCANSTLTPADYDTETGKVSATLSSITALTDTRDENVYAVAKLADGQCWMIENLRLDAENTRGTENEAKAQGYGDATASYEGNLGKFIGLADSEDANFTATSGTTAATAANSLYYAGTQSGTATMNILQDYYAGNRIPRYNDNNTNTITGATNSAGITLEDKYDSYNNTNDNHIRWYGYGNYYNWPAAMASTGYHKAAYNTDYYDVAGTSICPSGWHLPLGYISTGELNNPEASSTWRVGSFSYLDRVMGGTGASSSTNSVTNASNDTNWRSFPNNFVYSGYWNGKRVYDRNLQGGYWSLSVSTSSSAYYLSFSSNSVYPGTASLRYLGYSVRCVAGS